MNRKNIHWSIIFLICCLGLYGCSSAFAPKSYLPSDFGQGTYSAQYLLGASGIELSTVPDDSHRMEGYYRYQGKDHPIYMVMELAISEEGGEARIYYVENNVEILYVWFICSEDQIVLRNMWDVNQNTEHHVDLFEMYEVSSILLKKK